MHSSCGPKAGYVHPRHDDASLFILLSMSKQKMMRSWFCAVSDRRTGDWRYPFFLLLAGTLSLSLSLTRVFNIILKEGINLSFSSFLYIRLLGYFRRERVDRLGEDLLSASLLSKAIED